MENEIQQPDQNQTENTTIIDISKLNAAMYFITVKSEIDVLEIIPFMKL